MPIVYPMECFSAQRLSLGVQLRCAKSQAFANECQKQAFEDQKKDQRNQGCRDKFGSQANEGKVLFGLLGESRPKVESGGAGPRRGSVALGLELQLRRWSQAES
jgi:hypothetical protein